MSVKRILLTSAGLLLLVFLGSISSIAHHGNAAYETTLTTVKGTVTDFEFINPHVEVYFDVKDENGKVEKWDGEAGNTLALHRNGWNSKSLKAGDVATFIGNRAKSGAPVMRLMKVVLADGTELNPFPRTN